MSISQTNPPVRLSSLDALRGFDMFWIISGEGLFHAWAAASDNPAIDWMSSQLHHSDWNGFTFYDLIFPLFIFIAGVAMPYSMGKQLDTALPADRPAVKRKIFLSLLKRTMLLLLLGMVVNGLFTFPGYEHTRFASVLGRIALSCFLAGCIFLFGSFRSQVVWLVGLLLGYWALMAWVPVPGFGAGVLTPEGNLSAYLDRLWLPGKLHRRTYDPEGLLSTLPAVGNALLGIFTGQFLRWSSPNWTVFRKSIALSLASGVLIGLAWLWNPFFPINKNMWTSSFVLLTSGWSSILLALFYWVMDGAGYRKWALPFVWIGTNSILIYLASHGLVNFEFTAQFLFGGLARQAGPRWQPVWLAFGIVLVQLALLAFLYRKKWFLRI
jgi:predicted acyltransferase